MTTEFFDSFDGTRLALHRHGRGRPFVLLHGLFSSAQMNWIKWGHHEAIAAQGFEVLMLDFRVHGDSAAPHDPDSYPSNVLVRDVAALVAATAAPGWEVWVEVGIVSAIASPKRDHRCAQVCPGVCRGAPGPQDQD